MTEVKAFRRNDSLRSRRGGREGVKLWRRGAAPTAAAPQDFGCYGPDSIAWRVFSHNAIPAGIVQVTALLQFTHAGMAANFLDHDPLFRAAVRGSATPAMAVGRHRRTVGVAYPAILGDQPTAEQICAHLRRVHSRMQGVIPGTKAPYDAAGPELVLFGHVTLMHAALLCYERTGYHGPQAPSRLTDAERDQFWREVATFAVMMGANADEVPRSQAEVHAFYERSEPGFYNWGLMLRSTIRMVASVFRPRCWRDVRSLLSATLLSISHLPALGILPRPARRHLGIPRFLDPVIDVLFRVVRPAYALLETRVVGDRLMAWTVGPDGAALIQNARQLMATPADSYHATAA